MMLDCAAVRAATVFAAAEVGEEAGTDRLPRLALHAAVTAASVTASSNQTQRLPIVPPPGINGPHRGTHLTSPIVKTRYGKKQGLNHTRTACVSVRRNRPLGRHAIQAGEFTDSAALEPDRIGPAVLDHQHPLPWPLPSGGTRWPVSPSTAASLVGLWPVHVSAGASRDSFLVTD